MEKWDIHIHSKYSHDCRSKIRSIFKVAKKVGLDGLIITDHNKFKAYPEARKCAKEFGIGTVPGYEYKSIDGDILILGIEELIPPFLRATEAVKLVKGLGATVVAPHPYDVFRVGVGDLVALGNFDGIEVINSRTIFGRRRARHMAKKLHIAQCAGSDAHLSCEVGRAYTLCDRGDDILDAIRRGKTRYYGKANFKTVPWLLCSTFLSTPAMLRYKWLRWKQKRR